MKSKMRFRASKQLGWEFSAEKFPGGETAPENPQKFIKEMF
jgi:hypothetical protein